MRLTFVNGIAWIFVFPWEAKMNSRIVDTPTNVFAKLAAALIVTVGILCSAYAAQQISISASSGQEASCGHQFYRIDANGKEWPVTIQFTAQPKNGTASTKVSSASIPVKGQVRTVRMVQVVYKSKAGFSGYDSFTYRRITADPTDPNNGKEFTVAVTVR
jgi:hypothetical protein